MMKEITYGVLKEFGFDSLQDLYSAIFSFKFSILGIMITTIITILEQLIDRFIYTPSQGILILVTLTIFDMILGVARAVQDKEGVDPAKMMRAMIRLVVQISFVAVFFQMSRIWDHLIATWMVDFLLILFTLSTFWSAVKNAKSVGMITADQYSVLEGLVGLKKIFEKVKKLTK